MRFSAALLLGVAGLAAAQSSTTAAAAPSSSVSASGCGTAIDKIITACLASTEPQVKACAANDWKCMCTNQQAVVTCYNNCPSDPNAFGANQQLTSWCDAAKAEPQSSTTYATTGMKTTATAVGGTSSSSTTTAKGVHTGFASASGSAAASSSPTGAANAISPAGGLVAAIFGLALL